MENWKKEIVVNADDIKGIEDFCRKMMRIAVPTKLQALIDKFNSGNFTLEDQANLRLEMAALMLIENTAINDSAFDNVKVKCKDAIEQG